MKNWSWGSIFAALFYTAVASIIGYSWYMDLETCKNVSVPYQSVQEDDSERDVGDDYVYQEGVDGENTVCTKNSGTVTETVVEEPVDETTYIGTREPFEYEEDESSYNYGYRSGALCNDGTYSSATGSGACSWHDGVSEWLY